MIFAKLPIIKNYYLRFHNKINRLERQINTVTQENINLRFRLKSINNEKINVVFICWRPAIWTSLKSVYEEMKKDSAFNVTILTIPNKKQLPKLYFNHENYESEGAEDFWKGEDVVRGFDYDEKKWKDLRELKPDYVCLQQPYNGCRPEKLKACNISQYSKIFYVHYASNFIANEVLENSTPIDFFNYVSFMFNQNKMDYEIMKKHFNKMGNDFTKQYLTGFPRYDELKQYENMESDLWSLPRDKNNFRVIWTPRWCTDEGNCNFFDYKDYLLKYCEENPNVDFVFRPHPQAFSNWVSTGELTEEEEKMYRDSYKKLRNTTIDESKEYFATFFSSDCIITDVSSIISDYFLTGNPIIYCHKKDYFNDYSRKLAEGFYWVRNWNELEKTLEMIRSGNDPLKEKRNELKNELYYFPKNGSGAMIKDIIKRDFNGEC